MKKEWNRLKLSVKEDKDEKDSESKIEYGTKNYTERSWGEQIIDVVSPKLVKDSVKNLSSKFSKYTIIGLKQPTD